MRILKISLTLFTLLFPTILLAEDNSSKEDKNRFDSGFFYSTWGIGIQNSYTSPNWEGVEYVASLAAGEKTNKIDFMAKDY